MSKIYLISPPKVELKDFLINLEVALKTNKVPVFQLRLKGYQDQEVIDIGREILPICRQNQTIFIVNDRIDLALKIGVDGVHLGSEDKQIAVARKNSPANFIIGASCYDSRHLAVESLENGADYLSFGTFFHSQTKNSQGKPEAEILKWCNEVLQVNSVAIGGITADNCQGLIKAEADFLAVISYVWNNRNGVKWAIESLFKTCIEFSL